MVIPDWFLKASVGYFFEANGQCVFGIPVPAVRFIRQGGMPLPSGLRSNGRTQNSISNQDNRMIISKKM